MHTQRPTPQYHILWGVPLRTPGRLLSHPFRVYSLLHPPNLRSIPYDRKNLTLTQILLTLVNLGSLLVYTLPPRLPPSSHTRGQRPQPHSGFTCGCSGICHVMKGPGASVSLLRNRDFSPRSATSIIPWPDLTSAVFSSTYSSLWLYFPR